LWGILTRNPISLLAIIVLGLSALLLVGVQTAKAQGTPDGQLAVTVSPSNAIAIDVIHQLHFSASANGGTPPYSYQWYSNGNPVEDATSSGFIFEPNRSGTYEIFVIINDTSGAQASSNATLITVNPWLSMNIEQGSAKTQVDQLVQFTVIVTGGTPPYTYQWYYQLHPDGERVAGATSPTFAFPPTASGTYMIFLIVKDSLNYEEESESLPLTVTVAESTPSPSSTPSSPPPTPTPTLTPTSSPTPIPLDGLTAFPLSAVVIVASVAAIAALVLLREQRRRQIEKPKA